MESLYAAIGGEPGIDSVVDSMYAKVLADPRLTPFFEDLDMVRQRAKFRAFLHTICGGPVHRSPIELRAAQSASVGQGLAEHHLGAFVGHLESALADVGVGDDVIRRLTSLVGQAKSDVLGH